MKTLVLLSLISLCQSAPPSCETLLKPLDRGPDLTGRWYFIAMSAEYCLATTLLDAFINPSFVFDVTAKDTPNIYNSSVKVAIYGACTEESETFFYKDNKMFDVGSDNAPVGKEDVLLYSGCPDCVVVKANDMDMIDTLMLVSRRKVVSAAELTEFEAQAECLKWSKPIVFRADQDFETCKFIDDISNDESSTILRDIALKVFERVSSKRQSLITCLVNFIINFFLNSK